MTEDFAMNKAELEARIREELHQPFYVAKMDQARFTETEYQEIKAQLQADYEKYIEEFVNPQEN
ncbi:MAG: hypothetical protein LBV19_10945 [Streptococcaceae bacterium]|jgi:hypothetical protein|nr:hypothetical protein [Streptococcaceae bacterium]